VLTTHPIAVIGASGHDNLYYVPPGDLLGPDPQAARFRAWTRTLDERKESSRVPVEPHASSTLDENGEVESFHSFHADTTERRRAEEELRQSEANVKALLNAPFDSALLCEPDGTIVDLNEPAAKRMGTSTEELVGKNAFDLFPPELAAQRKAMGKSVIASGEPLRFQDERDGMCFDISLYPVFDSQGTAVRVAIFASDITARKRMEEGLRRSEADVKALLNASIDSALLCDFDGTVVDLNEAAAARLGTTAEELKGKNVFDWFPPDVVAARKAAGDADIAAGKPVRFQDERDGMCFDVSLYPVFDSQGTAVRVAIFATDITERKRAEQELERAHARTEAVIRAIPDMMFICRGDGTYLDFLPADGEKPYVPPSEFIGRTVLEVMPIGLARRMMHNVEAALNSGDVHSIEYELETDGEVHKYEARIVAMAVDEVLAIVRDVTAQEHMAKREQRRRARDELEGTVERSMLGRNPYGLTFREFSVLHLVARGAADKEIADQLGISTFTVNKHVANILGKMNASSRTEASVRAHREGLIN
jgi:PAS domain S-box-containing protein